jgi:hypothetical protein
VWHQHDVLEREESLMHVRLVLVDVEPRALDDPLAQRPRQSIFVDNRTPDVLMR